MANRLVQSSKQVSRESSTEEEDEEVLYEMYEMIINIIKSWDLDDEIPCGKCDICMENKNRDEDEEELEECQSKRIVSFPLEADRLDELPAWLLGEIVKALVSPNRKAPQRKRRKS
jgi:hypothetical protein